jgi:hypothetical protein
MSSQPRRSARIASKMSVARPVVTNPSVSNQQPRPRRSPRIAAKRRASMASLAKNTLLPIFIQLEHTQHINTRVVLIIKILSTLTISPNILIWNPKFRGVVSNKINHIWNQVNNCSDIGMCRKHELHTQITFLQQTLVKIQSHPEYTV